ncbi:MAG: biotin carboxylase N-terminal domain-containing protein [Pseudomonadota bacterium]
MFKKILIANRGEIACRIARTARAMGIAVATVHSRPDATALHVKAIGESVLIGEGPARESYLDIEAVIAAAKRVGADAIHPGFGFLSENAEFAQRCAQESLRFIGPAPEVLALFGDKASAKKLATQLGIPTAGGLQEPSDDPDRLIAALADLPVPYILKAVAGGGGKGMRVVRDTATLRADIEGAIREGRSSFGDGRLIAERYLNASRHIEVQILGDGRGNVIHLFDRECSLQRRHQKVIEEAPVTSIAQAMREQLWQHAVKLGEATNYLGLGTVEFAVSKDGTVFLEVNPRLQVEHPVTEEVLGRDLVALQIRTVHDNALPLTQAEVGSPCGVAIQGRLYAEDPARGFVPSTGPVACFEAPPGVRVDAGVESGSTITPYYDPMIAKLIVHADDRPHALAALHAALGDTTVLGVTCNRSFLMDLLSDAAVRANRIDTEFIDHWLASRSDAGIAAREVAAAMALWLLRRRQAPAGEGAWNDWTGLTGWRFACGGAPRVGRPTWTVRSDEREWAVGFGAGAAGHALAVRVDGDIFQVSVRQAASASDHLVSIDGDVLRVRSACADAHVDAMLETRTLSLDIEPAWSDQAGGAAAGQGLVRAPMMGLVIAVHVEAGQAVAAGERLATLESMKMEMTIAAPVAGIVRSVGCEALGKVERNQQLFLVEA